MRIPAAYMRSRPTRTVLRKGWKPNKTTVRVGISTCWLIGTLAGLVYAEERWLLAIVPACLFSHHEFYALIPTRCSSEPSASVVSMRVMTLMRMTYVSLLFNGLPGSVVLSFAALSTSCCGWARFTSFRSS